MQTILRTADSFGLQGEYKLYLHSLLVWISFFLFSFNHMTTYAYVLHNARNSNGSSWKSDVDVIWTELFEFHIYSILFALRLRRCTQFTWIKKNKQNKQIKPENSNPLGNWMNEWRNAQMHADLVRIYFLL